MIELKRFDQNKTQENKTRMHHNGQPLKTGIISIATNFPKPQETLIVWELSVWTPAEANPMSANEVETKVEVIPDFFWSCVARRCGFSSLS